MEERFFFDDDLFVETIDLENKLVDLYARKKLAGDELLRFELHYTKGHEDKEVRIMYTVCAYKVYNSGICCYYVKEFVLSNSAAFNMANSNLFISVTLFTCSRSLACLEYHFYSEIVFKRLCSANSCNATQTIRRPSVLERQRNVPLCWRDSVTSLCAGETA